MKKVAVWIALSLLVVMTSALGVHAQEGLLKVGVILPLTGAQAYFGEIQKNSFLMGMEEINAAGGVNGKKIELIFEDDEGNPQKGRAAVEKLVSQDKVTALTGGYASSVTYLMCSVAQQLKVPFLVTTGSSDNITEQNWDYVFRLCPPNSHYTQALFSFLAEVVKPKTVVIFSENSLFGNSASEAFSRQCMTQGIKVLAKNKYEPGEKDFKSQILQAKEFQPDFVYIVSYVREAVQIIRQARELNFNPKLFVGGGAGFNLPDFALEAGAAAENVFSVDLWSPNVPYPGVQKYIDKYKARFRANTEYHGAEAYASIYVMADALKRAQTPTPQGVKDALVSTNITTVFGPVRFGTYGRQKQQNLVPVYLVQWQKGVLETVWPKNRASKPYVYPTSSGATQ